MKYLLSLAMLVALIACKKDPIQYTFEGTVTENFGGSGLSGVTINIYQKPFNNAVTSNTWDLAGSAITDGSGFYSITFDRVKVTEFQVEFTKTGFFDQQTNIGSGDVSSENTNVVDAELDGRSWLRFDVQNVFPSDPSDDFTMIFYTYRTGCTECIEQDYNYYTGELDTVFKYQNTAGEYLKFTYIDVSGGQATTDSVYMTPFDTVFYNINY